MTIKIEGDAPEVVRIKTGLWSFDRAVGNPRTGEVGLPARSLVELFGHVHCGKSTLAYYLSGCGNPKGTVVLADVEGVDREFLISAAGQSGFGGTIRIVPEMEKKKPRPQEEMLMELADSLWEESVTSGIFDSVSSFAPRAEKEGEIGERFVGNRAFAIAQFSRRATQALRESEIPKNVYVINHQYQIIGGMGYVTAGGKVLEALKGVSIRIWRSASPGDKINHELDHFVAMGKINKLRFGGKGREFRVCLLAGQGVHRGLTAMFDCVEAGRAERTKQGYIKIGDKSVGRIGELIAAAEGDKDKTFEPFIEALEST